MRVHRSPSSPSDLVRWASVCALAIAGLGCAKGRSTVGLAVVVEPARPVHSLLLVASQGDTIEAEQVHDWAGPATYALFLPSHVSGRVDIRGEGRDPTGAVIAAGSVRTSVQAGKITGPVRLVLVPTGPGPGEDGRDAGSEDGPPDAREDAPRDAEADTALDTPAGDARNDLAPADGPGDVAADVENQAGADASPDTRDAAIEAPGPTCGPGDGHCPAGCQADPDCAKPIGQPCASPTECASQSCVDGKCCNDACAGPCRTCATGTCAAIVSMDDTPACPVGSTCGLSGQCRKKRGQMCQGAAECDSGYCVDGACCNDACSASCQSCSTGTCAPVRDAPDPPQCAGTMGCDSQGACITAPTKVPTPVWPWNGEATGSVFSEQARRPRFRWTGATGATRYEIQVDDSCSVSGFLGCTFPSPEATGDVTGLTFQPAALPVSMVKPVGRRYFWRVRACNAVGCSPWSPVRYLDVGRQTRDFNGDGYADLLVGGGNNEAWLFLGSATPDNTVDLQPRGTAVAAAGDVNADGYADMLIGETNYGFLRAYVYLGGATLDKVADATLMATLTGMEQFGRSVAGAGDVDADGYADVLVAAPVDDAGGGRVFLFRGGAAVDGSADLVLSAGSNVYRFGTSIASVGDRNGDGYADFAVMAPQAPMEFLSEIFIYQGGSTLDQNAATETSANGVLCVTPGDVDGDGRGDIVLVQTDRTYVYFAGNSPGGRADVVLPFGNENGGAAMMADVDRDGFSDVLVGDNAMGRVELFRGGLPMDAQRDGAFVTEMANDAFGGSISVLDLNGDGFPDVAVGAHFNDSGAYAGGRIYFYRGAATLDTTVDLRFDGTEAEDSLGQTLALLRPRAPVLWRGRR